MGNGYIGWILASAISAFVASAALAGIKKAQAELQNRQTAKQASERLMLAQQQRKKELASLEARINKRLQFRRGRDAGSRAGDSRLRAEITASAAAATMVSGTDKTRDYPVVSAEPKELSDTLGEFGQNQKTSLRKSVPSAKTPPHGGRKAAFGAAEHGKQHKQYDIRQREKAGAHTGSGG